MPNADESVSRVRTIKAPTQQVFAAWIDPRQLERWLTQSAQTEACVGGRFHLEVRKGDATHVVAGEYRELVPGRRIVKTWVYEGPYVPNGKMEVLLTVEFRESGRNTEVPIRHEGLTSPRYREAIRQGAWDKVMDNLETLLSGASLASS